MTDEQKTIDPDDIGLHTLRPNPGSRKARKRYEKELKKQRPRVEKAAKDARERASNVADLAAERAKRKLADLDLPTTIIAV